jgi:hypothetical protein
MKSAEFFRKLRTIKGSEIQDQRQSTLASKVREA